MGVPDVITFQEDGGPLSMGHQGEPLHFQGRTYPTAEHLFQCLKTTSLKDHQLVMSRPTPEEARAQGQRLIHMRLDWLKVQIPALQLVIDTKFRPGRAESGHLLATEDAMLVHVGNERWRGMDLSSIPLREEGDEADVWHLGTGLNWLGRLMMARRAELIASTADILDHLDDMLWQYVRWTPPTTDR
jgi:predicted NAD-dependent protein-ADP-ribosyltransferase YbiA (DUF1768 family)